MLKEIIHLSELKDRYSTFALPIYGFLHDTQRVNRNSYHILEKLREVRKTVVIFTNLPYRRQKIIDKLKTMGIAPNLYQHVITAGEETWKHLKSQHDPFHASLGEGCYFIGPIDTFEILKDLPFHRVGSIDQADYILVMGLDEWHPTLQYYQNILEQAVRLKLPMVCGSADQYLYQEETLTLGAGVIAHKYEDMGGHVYYHGKPYREVYTDLLKEVDLSSKEEILLIGNSLLTDIQGASKAHLDCLLLIDLTTYEELGESPFNSDGSKVSLDQIFAKIQKMGYSPTYVTRDLKW